MKIGRVTISDRAHAGVYEDRSGPEIERILLEMLGTDAEFRAMIVPDEQEEISGSLRELAETTELNTVEEGAGAGGDRRGRG